MNLSPILRGALAATILLLATAAARTTPPQSEPDRISVDQLHRKMLRRERLTIIDARDGNAWIGSTVRLPGAIHLTLRELESRMHEIPRGREIIVYCT